NGHGLTGIQIGDYFSKLEREHPGAARTINGVTLLEPEGINILSFDLATSELCYKPLRALSRREYRGAMAQVTTHDRRSLRVTDQHPMIVWENDAPRIKRAMDLRAGDELILPTRFPETAMTREIDLIAGLTREEIAKTRVAPKRGNFKTHRDALTPHLKSLGVDPYEIYRANRMSLRAFLELETRGAIPLSRRDVLLRTGRGPSANSVPAIISIDENFARLIGYYLSEGCVTRDKSLRTRWTFNSNEREYIDDLCHILDALEMRYSKRKDRQWNAVQIKVSSNLFGRMIRDVLQCGTRSTEMQIPGILLESAEPIRRALLAGLLRGDGDVFLEQRTRHYQHKAKQRAYDHHINVATVGYFSSSPRLFQQTILLAQGLGFVPTFKKGTPYFRFYGEQQLARLIPFFDGAKRANLESYAAHRRKRMPVKSFATHDGFATVRVAQVDLTESTQPVYSAEVEDTHTFVTSFGIVTHNCIPVDPYYLSWKAREYDFFTRFIELAADINQGMPYHVVKLISDALSARGKALKRARVLVLGVAFKPNVDDARNSPAERVIELLLEQGARVRYHDPFVPEFRIGNDVFHREPVTLKSAPLTRDEIRRNDVVVIVTAHRERVNYRAVVANAGLIVDTANATKGLGHAEKIVRLGAPQKRSQ
ncbi:MAG: hypothetical protein HZC40_24550, partial [Chloroflexi bacterium]|nr:hypothetical protein [Chloroflexota bacterium]